MSFNIGSVEVFEKNLEHAQQDLGILPSHYVPVTYKTETDYIKSMLVNVLPTLLIIGGMVFGLRRMASATRTKVGRGLRGWDFVENS